MTSAKARAAGANEQLGVESVAKVEDLGWKFKAEDFIEEIRRRRLP